MHNKTADIPDDERLYPLLQVATRPFMPRGPRGKPIHRTTILAAKKPRADGRHLQTASFGGRYYTCDKWLREYLDRDSRPAAPPPRMPSVAQRARRARAIDRELAAAGI